MSDHFTRLRLLRLDSSTNSPTSAELRTCKDTWISVSRDVRLRLLFDGQDPDGLSVTWAICLEQLTGMSSQIFAYQSPHEVLRLPLTLTKVFSYRKNIRMSSWILESQVDDTGVRQKKELLNVDELVQTLTEMLSVVAIERCFTSMSAVIWKGDYWIAATYKLSYTSHLRNINSAWRFFDDLFMDASMCRKRRRELGCL